MSNVKSTFTTEQKEAWINAKLLLKQLIAKHDTLRVRALHIAMSELRALRRTHRGPIETSSEKPNKKTQRETLDRQDRLRERVEEWKAYFADPGARKLFIIIKSDLSPSQKAVQASHAAAQFQKDHPLAPWVNGTMILLTPDPNYKDWRTRGPITLESLADSYLRPGTFRTIWREPDMDNCITAVCFLKEFENSEISQTPGLKLL